MKLGAPAVAACAQNGILWPAAASVDTAVLARRLLTRDEVPNCKLATLAPFFRTRTEPDRGAAARELAEAFCRQARGRVEHLFRALWDNTDATDRRLARRVLDGRYAWLEEGVVDPSEGTGPWIADWSADGEPVLGARRPFGS